MFGEQDALLGHPECLFGLVVLLLQGVQFGELEVQIGGVHLLQVVPLDHPDAFGVGFDGRVIEGFGAVNVPQLFVGFGDRGLVVVADGLVAEALQFILREGVFAVFAVIGNQPRPDEVVVCELVVFAGELLGARHPDFERV